MEDSARSQAGDLWQALITYCAPIRRKGGQITLEGLLDELAHRFLLKQHPRCAADWNLLSSESRQRMEAMPDKIGGLVSVDRAGLRKIIDERIRSRSEVVLLGGSGNGKSVLARNWAGTAQTLWLGAADLGTTGGLRARFRLTHDITDLVRNVSCPSRLVLDGLDKCFEEAAFDEAGLVLRAAASAESAKRWETVVTCCPEDWERVRGQLIRRGVLPTPHIIRVDRFSGVELRSACQQIPSLRVLVQRPHLHPILKWPKALDIVATYWQASDAPVPWATESAFARWFWRSAICKDELTSKRDRLARRLAVDLADRMAASASLNTFTTEEAEVFVELAREGHLEIDPLRGNVRFSHELIADWARQRELQLQGETDGEFLRARLHSPFWHRALRFHGLDLLETEDGTDAWQRLFLKFDTASPADEMARNLLLEAPIFAAAQQVVLERLWPLLQADDGKLLRRFLRQFLRIGTIPNDEIVGQFRSDSPDLQLEAAAHYRLPWVPYWKGVLSFLGTYETDVTALAREEIADVCLLWLPLHEFIKPGMNEAAQIAITAARKFYRGGERWHGGHRGVSPEEKVCQALLAAAPVMPAEVSKLALKLSGRLCPEPEDRFADEEETIRSRSRYNRGQLQPWPDGPQCRKAGAFRKAFMNGNHAAPLIRALPDVAAEVMLSVLLSLPREDWDPRDRMGGELDEHGFDRGDFRHESPLWINGPFLAFLRINPSVALPAIIRLVNFATERAMELGEDVRQHIEVPVTVDGLTNIWRGHQFSYLWPEGHVFGPRAVGCALLSLEKWFYMMIDEHQPIEKHIATVLRESRSIALAAVLVSVGKRQPDLFLGPLRPLLEAIDFFWIEESLKNRAEGGYRASGFYERSTVILKMWREWVQMPHRKESFGQLALRMFLGDQRWREAIAKCREVWQRRIEDATPENPAPHWLPRIASQFEIENWHVEQHEQGTLIAYEPPTTLPQPSAEELDHLRRVQLLTFLPFQCRQVLMGEAECSEEQMAEWWSQLEAVRSLSPEDGERGFRDIEDALCGVVAVAVVRHRGWLATDPRREKEARAILAGVGEQPPPPFWLSGNDFSDFKWDTFAAWAVTTLWCEQPNDPDLRQAVGALALWDRYVVVERVMIVAAQHRAALGNHFEQLLAHTIRYAPARHRAELERYAQPPIFDRDAWVRAHLEKFIAGQTEPLPSRWINLAEPQARRGQRNASMTRGLDISHVNAALTWAEDLSAARDKAERAKWVEYHRKALVCALGRIERMIASPSKPEPWYNHHEDLPFDDEQRLLERIGRVVARLGADEDHRVLWEPILALGGPGGHWVGTFLVHWRIEAAGPDEPRPAFVEQWRAMLSYAENSPAWKRRDQRASISRDLWEDMLGYSVASADFWHEKLLPAVEAVRSFHENWARAHLGDEHDARSFIRFLMTKAARGLRINGLRLLHETVPLNDEYFWHDDDIRDVFARFLRLLLDEHWEEVARDPSLRDAFISLALKLGALQHPLGSELLNLAGHRLGMVPA